MNLYRGDGKDSRHAVSHFDVLADGILDQLLKYGDIDLMNQGLHPGYVNVRLV